MQNAQFFMKNQILLVVCLIEMVLFLCYPL